MSVISTKGRFRVGGSELRLDGVAALRWHVTGWVLPALCMWDGACSSLNGAPPVSSNLKSKHLTFDAGVGSPYMTICAVTLQHTCEGRLAPATRRSVLHTTITAILGYTSIPDMVNRL